MPETSQQTGGRTKSQTSWTSVFLVGVIVTLSLAAIMGLAAVLSMRVNLRLVGTDLVISLFSLTCLAASYPRHTTHYWRLAVLGTYLTSAIGLVLSLLLIWEAHPRQLEETIGKGTLIVIVWSIALPAMSLLALTRFANALSFARSATLLLIAILAAEITVAVLLESDTNFLLRAIAATTILAALGTLSLPILHRLYGQRNPTKVESAPLRVQIVCPRCSHTQFIPAGEAACVQCQLGFKLEIEEPRCRGCGYLLYQLRSSECPECGRAVS